MIETFITFLTAVALEGQPLCTPLPVVAPLRQTCEKADGTPARLPGMPTPARLPGMPENTCQTTAEGGRLLITGYVYTVDIGDDRSVYTIQTRERWHGASQGYTLVGTNVYRESRRVSTGLRPDMFAGEKMLRVRPPSCDLPIAVLDDA